MNMKIIVQVATKLTLLTLFTASNHGVTNDLTSCTTCHGENMGGNQALAAPNLTGLDKNYLQQQLTNYRNGIRGKNPEDSTGQQMAVIAQSLTDKQIEQLADQIAVLPPIKPDTSVAGKALNGASYYQSICGACHGPNAEGNALLQAPALAGQSDWYLVQQMKNFKAGIRGGNPDDQLGQQMVMMAKALPDEQAIVDIISYISSINDQPE